MNSNTPYFSNGIPETIQISARWYEFVIFFTHTFTHMYILSPLFLGMHPIEQYVSLKFRAIPFILLSGSLTHKSQTVTDGTDRSSRVQTPASNLLSFKSAGRYKDFWQKNVRCWNIYNWKMGCLYTFWRMTLLKCCTATFFCPVYFYFWYQTQLFKNESSLQLVKSIIHGLLLHSEVFWLFGPSACKLICLCSHISIFARSLP